MAQENRTERATPRRRQKAREQGQVARSRDLIAGIATLAAVLALGSQAESFAGQWRGWLRQDLDMAVTTDFGPQSPLLQASGAAAFRAVSLVLGLSWMAALLGALAQGGLVVAPAALQPNFSRLSPATRLQQLFSLPSVGRLLKSMLPVAALAAFAVTMLGRDWSAMITLPRLAVHALAAFSLQRVFEIAWKSGLVLLLWAGADYMIEKHRLESDLRMSKQDVRDEFKEIEGHPAIKARIRRLQRQLRRRRMLEEVKRATVVITNPSEYAVALEYRPDMPAPKVVAKGLNLFAQQIKDVARWEGIPLVENPPLAHALYRLVDVGQSIPPKLYAVVAGILAAIYRAEQQARARAGATAGGR